MVVRCPTTVLHQAGHGRILFVMACCRSIWFDCDENEGVDDLAEQTDVQLEEVGADSRVGMSRSKLRQGRTDLMSVIGGCTRIIVQYTAFRFAGDVREACQALVVDPQGGSDFFLPDPWPSGFLGLLITVTVGLALLITFEPTDENCGRDDPLKLDTEWPDLALHDLRVSDAVNGCHAHRFTLEATLRGDELLVDGFNEVVDWQAQGDAAQHPEVDANSKRQRLGYCTRRGLRHGR